MAKTAEFELVAPEELLLSELVELVVVPGAEGDFGVLPGHSPLISTLRTGVITVYEKDKVKKRLFVSGGFVEINPEKCIVLAEEVDEMSSLEKGTIEQQMRDLENETSDELKQKYMIAKSKIEALNSSHYEKI